MPAGPQSGGTGISRWLHTPPGSHRRTFCADCGPRKRRQAEQLLESYRFGHLVVDGQAHTRDVIVLPDRVIGGWGRKEGHALHPEDLRAVFEAAPEVLVVGQGASGLMRVTQETRDALGQAGIELIALPTPEAVETYNRLRDARPVAAALHLTC